MKRIYSITSFDDCKIIINGVHELNTSKLALSSKSKYFHELIIKTTTNSFELQMEEKNVPHFVCIMKFLHNEFPNITIDDIIPLFQIAIQFDFYGFLNGYEKILESNKIEITAQMLTSIHKYLSDICVLGVNPYLYHIESPTPEIIMNFSNYPFSSVAIIKTLTNKIINIEFDSYDKMTEKKNVFLEIHPYSLVQILTNEKFVTDSEDSILAIVIMWLCDDFTNREKYIPFILPHVNLSSIRKYFLITMMNKLMEKIENADVKNFVRYKYASAFEEKMNPQNVNLNSNLKPKRAILNLGEILCMKVEFRKVNEFMHGEKYYSRSLFFGGYLFYFFVKRESNNILGGYVRCTGPDSGSTNYLPVEIEIRIETNIRSIKLPPYKTIFDHYDKSVGTVLSQNTWDKILLGRDNNNNILGNNNIIVNNTLTVIVQIKFITE
jgi:hypothetical protein